MAYRRILLVESLDAAGASVRDARTHARALQDAGVHVRSVVFVHDDAAQHAHDVPGDIAVMHAADAATLVSLAAAEGADAVIVAAAGPGGGGAGAIVREQIPLPAFWWPTGVAAMPAADGRLEPLALGHGVPPREEPWPNACAGLDASTVDDTRLARQQLPLWDGDYVLAPLPLAAAAGRVALDAFARVCASHDGLDLVVLADPQPEFERLARTLGIGFRVHFAGVAPRDAEFAWLGAAGAALVAGDAALSGGLVLRALERGCPVLPVAGSAIAAPLEAWLARAGAGTVRRGEALPERLERVLGRGDGVAESVAAGRRAADEARLERLSRRLAEALAPRAEQRRAA